MELISISTTYILKGQGIVRGDIMNEVEELKALVQELEGINKNLNERLEKMLLSPILLIQLFLLPVKSS